MGERFAFAWMNVVRGRGQKERKEGGNVEVKGKGDGMLVLFYMPVPFHPTQTMR